MPLDGADNPELAGIVPVILAGGAGSRLWPLSTLARPKPFIRIMGGPSFLQKTAARLAGMKKPYIVCHERHRELAMQQVDADQIILEPESRGTAPAVAAAAHYLSQHSDPLLLVLPSDHAVRQPEHLRQAIIKAIPVARAGWLVTFGINPRGPSPHYGYIHAGATLENGVFEANRFVEKPGRRDAAGFIRGGGHYWNSGMFLFSAKTYLAALQAQQPRIFEDSLRALSGASRLRNSIVLSPGIFSACPALSIDYAVMEKAERRAVLPVSMGWRDLGTWPSFLAFLLNR